MSWTPSVRYIERTPRNATEVVGQHEIESDENLRRIVALVETLLNRQSLYLKTGKKMQTIVWPVLRKSKPMGPDTFERHRHVCGLP